MAKVELDISMILANKLTLEAYFILFCVYSKDKESLLRYVKEIKVIPIEVYYNLEDTGYIRLTRKEDIEFKCISLSDQGKQLFKELDAQHLFYEFKRCYPSQIKQGNRVLRRLHTDLPRCKQLYAKALLTVDHIILCKCAKLYHREHIINNSEQYMHAMATWLHQRNYEQYIDEASKISIDTIEGASNDVQNNYDVI